MKTQKQATLIVPSVLEMELFGATITSTTMKTTIDTTKYTRHLHPGKFEGESPEAEYYWEQMLNGDGETIYADSYSEDQDDEEFDNDGPIATVFCVDAEESEAFDLPIGATYMILEDSQGFVYGSVHADPDEAEREFRQWLGLEDSK